jgi:hypothetical protein
MDRFDPCKLVLLWCVLCGILPGCMGIRNLGEATPRPSLPSASSTVIRSSAILPDKTETFPLSPISTPDIETFEPPEALHPTPASTISPFPIEHNAHAHYTLKATLDYAAHTLSVEERVSYRNDYRTAFTSIPMVIELSRYPGAFHLSELLWEDGSRITQYQLKEMRLTLNLPRPLQTGETINFSLSYLLKLPDTDKLAHLRPYPMGYTKMQVNLGDWYPFIPPYDEKKGWLIHEPGFFGEHLAYDVADFDVDIILVGEQTGLVLAASAPVQMEENRFHYHHPAARSFAWSASPHYQVITQTVEIPGSSPVTVASYYFPFYEQAGNRIAETIGQAMQLYSRLYGIGYTHPVFSAVQADFLDGMEYEGIFFLSRDFYNWFNGSTQDFLVALTAHETAHQWFYGLVGNDQALEPWLDEATCTYSERLFYENYYPESLDWWWAYRVEYYQPTGWVDTNIYDTPQVAGQYRLYRDAVYLNGAVFLEELRTLIGDQVFFEALRSYLSQNKYGFGTTAGFFETVGQYSDIDIEPLVNKFFSKAISISNR